MVIDLKMYRRAFVFGLLNTCILLSAATLFGQSGAGRPWTVEDSLATRYFIDWTNPGYFIGAGKNILRISPDGRRFVIGTHRGDLTCDCTRYEISIYSTEQVRNAIAQARPTGNLAPLHSIRMASTSGRLDHSGSGIREVIWKDNDTLLLVGTGEMGSNAGVFLFHVNDGKLQRLTDPTHNVRTEFVNSFDIKGGSIAYTTLFRRPQRRDAQYGFPERLSNYPSQPVRGAYDDFKYGLTPFFGMSDEFSGIYVAANGNRVHELMAPIQPLGSVFTPTVSPDGNSVLVQIPAELGKPIRAEFKRYEGLDAPASLMSKKNRSRLQSFQIFDSATGKKSTTIWEWPLGPEGARAGGFWSADAKRVVLANVSLPLTEDVENRRKKGYIVDYELSNGKWTVLDEIPQGKGNTYVKWLTEGKELLVQRLDAEGKILSVKAIELTDAGWKTRSTPTSTTTAAKRSVPELEGGMKVFIRESANDPPMAVATDGKSEVTLVEKDSALAGILRSRYQEVKWAERNGEAQTGGLYLPPDDGKGQKPYPLVIQINGKEPGRFWPDGGSRAAFATQALAAQGIAVLQVSPTRPQSPSGLKDKNGEDLSWSQSEWLYGPAFVERIDAAVAELIRHGLVDPKRIGILGFSYTGYLAYYVSTHPKKTTPAAAIVADSGLRGYADAYVNEPGTLAGFTARFYGGSFWDPDARKRWLEHAPTFSIDKLETPVLFSYNTNVGGGTWYSKFAMETWGAFRLNQKEYDLLLFPDGDHQLHRPKQRQASMQATVDWMSFWLLGKEIDPDKNEARQEQYYYWRQLKKQRDERWAKNGNPYDKLAKQQNTAASSTTPEKANVPSKAVEKSDNR